MNSSPEWQQPVLRGTEAIAIESADFSTDLRSAIPSPSKLVDRARSAAQTAGYAEGWAQGQRAAQVAAKAAADQAAAAREADEVRRAAALKKATQAMAHAAAAVEARQIPVLTDLADTILASALALAEAVIGYEIAHDANGPLTAVQRALAMVPTADNVTVRLHPNDHQALTGSATQYSHSIDGREISVRPDETLNPGDALATYGVTEIDATVAGALARAREVLGL